MSEEIGLLKNIKWIKDRILLVERADGSVLLVRKGYPCHHRTKDGDYADHLHFYITTRDRIEDINKLNKLIDWLEAGFWRDSMFWNNEEGLRNLIMRFTKYKCPGALQAI